MMYKFRAVNPKTNAEQTVEVDLDPQAVGDDESLIDLLTPHYPDGMLMIGGTFEAVAGAAV